MDRLNKITEIVKEIVDGNDKRHTELRDLAVELFKNKDQKEIDKFEKKKLKSLVESLDIIKKNELNDIDRGIINLNFEINSDRYITLNYQGDINCDILKKLVIKIHDSNIEKNIFTSESDERFMAWIGWVLSYENFFDDAILESKKKDLRLEIELVNYDSPQIYIRAIGIRDKEYERFVQDLKDILK